MKRRGALKFIGLVGIGAGGYALYDNDLNFRNAVPDELSNAVGPPPTETKLRDVTLGWRGSEGPFDYIRLFESGAAKLYFNTGHGMDEFTITHASLNPLDDPFKVWDAPTYEGPVVIDLKSVIEANGPYPNNKFTVAAYFDPNDELHLTTLPDPEFAIPSNWIDINS